MFKPKILWYSRGDGEDVVFLVEAQTEDEARAIMETLPLAKEQLMDHEYVPVGPLMPLLCNIKRIRNAGKSAPSRGPSAIARTAF